MAQLIKQGNIFGRVGTAIGKGLADQLPKEAERYRLSSALENLGQQQGLTPFQQYTGLVKAAHEYPQVVQGGSDLLRQQALINSIDRGREPTQQLTQENPNRANPISESPKRESSPSTTESTKARLQPYIPPTAQQREKDALTMMRDEPQKFRNIEEARSQVDRNVASETQRSNELIKKGDLERNVGQTLGTNFAKQLKLSGADNIPPILQERLQNKLISDVTDGVMSEDEAIKEGTKQATEMSKNFANLRALGGIGVALQNHRDIFNSMESYRKKAEEGGYKPEAADQMVTDVGVSPQFAYAQMYPVKDIPELNSQIKGLPNLKYESPSSNRQSVGDFSEQETRKICGKLAVSMGNKGSPLSIAYELEKKGYDPVVWKEFLQRNRPFLNLTKEQDNELGKTQPNFWSKMNDILLRESTGVE